MRRLTALVLAFGLALWALPVTAQSTSCVASALAGGTADALTVPLLPCSSTTNMLLLTLSGTNATSTPTLQQTGFAALPIVRADGSALAPGALPGAGNVVQLYSTGLAWKLLGSPFAGSAQAGLLCTGLTQIASAAYTVLSTDQTKCLDFTGASAVTLPDAGGAGFGANWATVVNPTGTGTVTLTPAVGTVCGGVSQTVYGKASVVVVSDGTNWQCWGNGGVYNVLQAQTMTGGFTYEPVLNNASFMEQLAAAKTGNAPWTFIWGSGADPWTPSTAGNRAALTGIVVGNQSTNELAGVDWRTTLNAGNGTMTGARFWSTIGSGTTSPPGGTGMEVLIQSTNGGALHAANMNVTTSIITATSATGVEYDFTSTQSIGQRFGVIAAITSSDNQTPFSTLSVNGTADTIPANVAFLPLKFEGSGGNGWAYGFAMVKQTGDASLPATNGVMFSGGFAVPRGIDFHDMTFTQSALELPSGAPVRWNNAGVLQDVSSDGSTLTVTKALSAVSAQLTGNLTVRSGFGVALGNTSNTATVTLFNNLGTPRFTMTSGANTLDLPNVTDTLVGKATTDTLTNKSYDVTGTGNVFAISGTQITTATGTGAKIVLSAGPNLTGVILLPSHAGTTTGNSTFDSTGRLIIGTTATQTIAAGNFDIQSHTTGQNMGLAQWSNSTGGVNFGFGHSRGGTIGTQGALVATDVIMNLISAGSDGTNMNSVAASIQTIVEGTVSAGVLPGQILLSTANAAGTLTGGLKINSVQQVNLSSGYAQALTVLGSAASGVTLGTTAGTLILSSTGATTTINDATIKLPNLPSSGAAQTGFVCFHATNGLTYDGGATCLISSARFKRDIAPLTGGLREVLAMRPVSYMRNLDGEAWLASDPNANGPQIGLIAEDVAEVDDRLVERDKDGRPLKVRYEQSIALAFAAIQEQQRQIDGLKPKTAWQMLRQAVGLE